MVRSGNMLPNVLPDSDNGCVSKTLAEIQGHGLRRYNGHAAILRLGNSSILDSTFEPFMLR